MLMQDSYLGRQIPEIAFWRPHIKGSAGAVTAPDSYAAQAGMEILQAGGNAADAAVAAFLAIGVAEPFHAGIGGGCFQLFYHRQSRQFLAVDARGVAPLGSYPEMFLDERGEVDPELTDYSGRSAAIPAAYRGLDLLLKKYGTMTWKQVSQPAIRMCRQGFVCGFMYEQCARNAEARHNAQAFEGFRELYWPQGKPPRYGQVLYNPQLADTMEAVAENGVDWFYEGPVGRELVQAANRYGGIFSQEDLTRCRAKERVPVKGSYRGYQVVSMPPPSSGGAHLIQMLNILENFDLKKLGYHSADSVHLLTEVMKIMYADRSVAMGDPDFVRIQLERIIDKEYARQLAEQVDMSRAREYRPNPELEALPAEAPSNTANFCVMDRYGNALVSTQTIRNWWGSGVVVPGRGFVLNCAMADFSPKPGVKTSHGMAYGQANSVRPGATPLSSMSPTLLMKGDEPYLALGAVGGPRIITSTLQMILNVVDYDMMMDLAVREPYLCCLNQQAGLELEFGFSPDTMRELERRGHWLRALPAAGVLATIPNGIQKLEGDFFPGETGRTDGAAGVLTENGSVAYNGTIYQLPAG